MDKKLEKYRARKQREVMLKRTSEKFSEFFRLNRNKKIDDLSEELLSVREDDALDEHDGDDCDAKSDVSSASDTLDCCTYSDFIYYGLCFALWALLFVVFIELQFGAIYFIVSALVAMYMNTRTGRKRKNEVSAYSVFNKNCESIDGTLKAEQLERQMIYGRLT